MDKMHYNKHYIKIDSSGRIVDAWSDGPHYGKDPAGFVCINEKGGYQFRLFPGGEENPALFDEYGIPLYKWSGDAVQLRTQEEIDADRAALPEPEPSAPAQDDIWAALDAAYREGVNNAYNE